MTTNDDNKSKEGLDERGPLHSTQGFVPLLSEAAISFLYSKCNPKETRLFEYGSGTSTMFYSKHCLSVFAVEHNHEWAQQVLQWVGSNGINNIGLMLVQPQIRDGSDIGNPRVPLDYASDDEATREMSYRLYASAIDSFPDTHFDIIVIDGRARPACLFHARSKLRQGGWLVMDNMEREYYHDCLDLIPKHWEKQVFSGTCPGTHIGCTTWVWQRS